MAVEYDCNLLHSIKLGGELTDIHSNVFSKYRRAKWCCEMIFDEYLSVFLDCYLVDRCISVIGSPISGSTTFSNSRVTSSTVTIEHHSTRSYVISFIHSSATSFSGLPSFKTLLPSISRFFVRSPITRRKSIVVGV